MKLSKGIKLLILLFMCSTVYFIYNKTNYNNVSYTIFGDGLALGIDSYGRRQYGYGDYVKDYLLKKKKLKNYSNEYTALDMTIEKLSNKLLTNEKMHDGNKYRNIKDILKETDYLTITIGMNDLLYKLSLTSEYTEENLKIIIKEINNSFDNLIREIRKVYRQDIYVIGYYDTDVGNNYYNKAIKMLNNIYKENPDITYISTYIISENKNIFLPNPNSYYPNYKGYQVISKKLEKH